LGSSKILENKFCSFWPDVAGLCTKKSQSCFWSSFSRWDTGLQQLAWCLNLQLKCISMYHMIGQDVANTVNRKQSVPMIIWHTFSTLNNSLSSWYVTIHFNIFNRNMVTFERQIPINSLYSTHDVIKKGCLKNFVILRNLFLKFKTIFCFQILCS
jgi:hypothetical protein